MKNKKGALLFAPMLLILMIVGLIYAYSEISARYKEFNKEIGEKQFELINTYQKGEKAMFYIDQSAKYSTYQGIYDLAKNGGCSAGDMHNEYRLWAVDSPKPGICFPSITDSKNGFFDFFTSILNNYMSNYKSFNLPQNNYELSFNGAALVGIAKDPLKLPIIEDISSKNIGIYSIKAPFKVNLENYDFSDYDKLKSKAQEVINKCGNANPAYPKRVPFNCVNEQETKNIFSYESLALSNCIDGKKPVEFLEYKWDPDIRSSIYGFCAKSSNPKVYAYEEADSTIGLKDITYRFALSFQDLECSLQGHPELVNTKCMESPCDAYYSCQDATPLCYCSPGTGNACQGQCLPFCSSTSGRVEDADSSTKCKEFSCDSYMSCTNVVTGACFCPDPSAAALSNACQGNNCDTLHCGRDTYSNTQCKLEACSYYDYLVGHSCNPTNLCECDFGNNCEGDCTCEETNTNLGCGGECGYRDTWEVAFLYGCQEDPHRYCGSCNPDCDPCDCLPPTTGCGVCGRDPVNECGLCPDEPCPDPTPEPSCSCKNACAVIPIDCRCVGEISCEPPLIPCKNNCP